MTDSIRFTKSSLRYQQAKLRQLELYLPTLKLKKALLQAQINESKSELEALFKKFSDSKNDVGQFEYLLDDYFIKRFATVKNVIKRYENIAGVEIPVFEEVLFSDAFYLLFDSPLWWDAAIFKVRQLIISRENIHVVEEKKRLLEKELHDVSIRVNLFEKVLIPTSLSNIKKIKIFLGDQELAFVAQAKMAKSKILKRKRDDWEG
jgi:V/A-type H+-transporting ATPase subunit D